MSLDVLLEAADVLEKQKVASILTSMHEYDKTFADNAEMAYVKRIEKKHNHRSPQHEMCSAQDMFPISDESTYSPVNRMPRRRLAPTKLTTRYTVSQNNIPPPSPPSPHDSDSLSIDNSCDKDANRELYNFKVENESSRSNISNSRSVSETWHTRSIHNQMEKNRRAQLRVFMNNLRDVIPSGPNRRKLTTLTLLQNARIYIESLKDHEEEYEHDKQKLWRRHLRLREFLCQLSGSRVLTLPGIPMTPGIRKYTVDQNTELGSGGCTSELMQVGDHRQTDTISELSDDDQSIGTFSNSDGGETVVSPDKDL